jgi:hypothetical protein
MVGIGHPPPKHENGKYQCEEGGGSCELSTRMGELMARNLADPDAAVLMMGSKETGWPNASKLKERFL